MQKDFQMKKLNKSCVAFENAFFSLLENTAYDNITVSSLVEKSGYTRTAFYSNYTDKEDFVEQLIRREVQLHTNSICAKLSGDRSELFDGYVYKPALELFKTVYEHRTFYRALYAGSIPGWSVDRFAYECENTYVSSFTVNFDRFPNFNIELYRFIGTYQFLSYVSWWNKHNFCYTPEYLAEQLGMYYNLIDFDRQSNIKPF